MKKFKQMLGIIVIITLLLVGCGTESKEDKKDELLTGKYNVRIDIKEFGAIELEIDADVAPITVTNFVNLVESGFYDGLTFHRIISGFMMQGGAGKTDSSNEVTATIKGEFEINGIDNPISHTRGVISMARAKDFDSASSQFFIMHKDGTFLDGEYAGFGVVTSGMEIVDQICEGTTVEDSNGTVLEINQPIIDKIQIVK